MNRVACLAILLLATSALASADDLGIPGVTTVVLNPGDTLDPTFIEGSTEATEILFTSAKWTTTGWYAIYDGTTGTVISDKVGFYNLSSGNAHVILESDPFNQSFDALFTGTQLGSAYEGNGVMNFFDSFQAPVNGVSTYDIQFSSADNETAGQVSDSYAASPVPEPASVLLLGAVLVGVMQGIKRKIA